MARRRLAYLSLETPREGQATHTHVHEMIAGLREIGWDVDLIVTTRGGASAGANYLTRGLDYIRAQWALARRAHEFDAVFMRAHFAALPVSAFLAATGKPVFQEINGLPDDVMTTYRWLRALAPLLRFSWRAQMRWARHVFVVTEGLRGWATRESGHGRVSVVSNGANTRLFSPEGERAAIEGLYVAFVGGVTHWHGIRTMIAATRDPAWPTGVRLVIVGDGVARAELEAARGERIVALGRRPQPEAAAILRGALCALSITEDRTGHLGTGVAPLKLFEAMASGAPVIVSDLPFQSELVRREQAGLVVPMADAPALAGAVASLAADPEAARRLGANGAAWVRASASWLARAQEASAIMTEALDAAG